MGALVPDITLVKLWLAATVCGKNAVWSFDSMRASSAELLDAARQEEVVALVSWRLQQTARELTGPQVKSALVIPSDVTKAFTTAAREEALIFMVIEGESRRVLGLMAVARISGLLLKGSALAYWAYSQPHLRACSDVDLLLPSREAAEQLSDRLTASGFERAETAPSLFASRAEAHD